MRTPPALFTLPLALALLGAGVSAQDPSGTGRIATTPVATAFAQQAQAQTVQVGEGIFAFDPKTDAPVGGCIFKRRPVEGQAGIESLTVDLWVWARQKDGFVAVTTIPNVVVDPKAWPAWVDAGVDDCGNLEFGGE